MFTKILIANRGAEREAFVSISAAGGLAADSYVH